MSRNSVGDVVQGLTAAQLQGILLVVVWGLSYLDRKTAPDHVEVRLLAEKLRIYEIMHCEHGKKREKLSLKPPCKKCFEKERRKHHGGAKFTGADRHQTVFTTAERYQTMLTSAEFSREAL